MQKENPLITVATVTYNSKWVKETIESVLSQTFTDYELLVCDDCSTDDTWQAINLYEDQRLRKYRNDVNIGEYPNRNKALSLARGKYILFIDGDDILYKDALLEYSRYIEAFPEAAALWGVPSTDYDFFVFPYLFQPQEITKLNFLSNYHITIVGFTDSVFRINELKKIGGLPTKYIQGDTFTKRRFACEFPVLLIPVGRAFWRQTPTQASNLVRKNYRNFIETFEIDKEILEAPYFPLDSVDKDTAILNFKIRSIKLLVKNTILKFKITHFFLLMSTLKLPYRHLKYLFKKGDYSYKANGSGARPLMNGYNFSAKHAEPV